MKLFFFGTVLIMFLSSSVLAQSGSGSSNQTIPELVFQNPVLISGVAGQDGAVYRFSNVAIYIDATIKIRRRSSSAVVLTNIDVSNMGWNKAFQPQLGIPGSVAPGQNWWMEFELKFLKAGTNDKKKIKNFFVTALDVDGDNYYIQEYVQMNKVKAVSCSPATYLVNDACLSLPTIADEVDWSGYNNNGVDKKMQGPIQNFINIDTAATGVMTTYSYEDKDAIRFIIGAKSSGGTSTAGERLNSLWFKQFNLAPPTTLPVKMTGFQAILENKNVKLKWTTATEENFSHYVIERSTDGKNYSQVATVFANGNTSQTSTYNYQDSYVSSSTGVIYYRLRLVEMSKESSYSEVKVIRLSKDKGALELTAFPNPARDVVKLTMPNTWQNKKVVVEVFSGNGMRVKQIHFANSSQTENINLSDLSNGIYVVKASSDGQILEQRIIKN